MALPHYDTSSDEGSQFELAESSVWSHRIMALVPMRDGSFYLCTIFTVALPHYDTCSDEGSQFSFVNNLHCVPAALWH